MTARQQATEFLLEHGIPPVQADATASEMVRFLRLLLREAERQERLHSTPVSVQQQKAKECREHSPALM
jgi:hypothetical protein